MKSVSLHIGLDNLDQSLYKGDEFSRLNSAGSSANFMAEVGADRGFGDTTSGIPWPNHPLLDRDANVANIKKFFCNSAAEMQLGSILFISYSGHGSQIPVDPRVPSTEPDKANETWCLWDRQFFDLEILEMLSWFAPGVRVLFISDSCHSGTIITSQFLDPFREILKRTDFNFRNFERKILYELGADFLTYSTSEWVRDISILGGALGQTKKQIDFILAGLIARLKRELLDKPKAMSLFDEIQKYDYEDRQIEYDEYRRQVNDRLRNRLPHKGGKFEDLVAASVIQISACRDDQKSPDGNDEKSLTRFCQAISDVWDKGKFPGKDYDGFHKSLVNYFANQSQEPQIKPVGVHTGLNTRFMGQYPFRTAVP